MTAPTPAPAKAASLMSRLPVLQGILPLDRAHISTDIVAGITLAALGIPEVMGYTKIAGMPVVTGLYTILIPIAVFALLGSSRHLVVGADSATAAIMAAGLVGLASVAPVGSANYVALAGILAIMTAAILILARLVGLGFLADFLSRSVLIGFLTGVGIQVAIGQVAGMLGVPGGTNGGPIEKFFETLGEIPQANWATVAVSAGVLGTIVLLRFVNKKIPGALIAVIGAIIVSYAIDLSVNYNVAVLGTIPSGLPSFGIPNFGWDDWQVLLPTAGALFLVILAQSAATSRAYAAKYSERFSENVDLVGLGAANLSAGLSGTFVVNGSPTKTQMVDSAGGRSQIAQLTTAAIVLTVILFLTKPLSYMPEAVLSSIVFLIGIELIDYMGMSKILKMRRDEFIIAALTAAVVVVVGVMQGILVAIILSVIDHLRFSYHPRDTYVAPNPSGGLTVQAVDDSAAPLEAAPGMVVYRFGAPLYYANANRFTEEVRAIIAADPRPSWVCIDLVAVGDIDFTGGETLLDLQTELAEHEARLVFAAPSDLVRKELVDYGVTEVIGAEGVFDTIEDAIAGFQARAK